MATMLYVTANPKQTKHSFGLQVGEHFLSAYKQAHPNDTIEHFDTYKENIPFIDAVVLSAWEKATSKEALNDEEQKAITRIEEIVAQFIRADKVVFVTPLWNLSFPPMFKAYIDTIVIAGKTFKYTENGPIGLVEDKPVLHIFASGGTYSKGPTKELDFTNPYLKGLMNFMGISNVQVLRVEGTSIAPDIAETNLKNAKIEAEKVAKNF